MPVVDTLITKYQLDSSHYEKGIGTVVAATERAARSVGSLSKNILSGLGLSGGLGVAGLLGLGVAAVKAAMDFDTLSRSLEAITKSKARADAILKFTDKLAIPSIFTSQQLAEAALTLEALQLKTEQYLPVAEKLATVFGGSAEALAEYVRALGMIKGGRAGEGLEALARAGISRDDLAVKYHLEFDGGGQYLGDTKKLLDAVEAEVNARFGGLSKAMSEGPAAKFASLLDSVTQALRPIGSAILSFVLPSVNMLSTALTNITAGGKDGVLGRVVAGFTGLFDGVGFGHFLIRTLAWVVVIFESLPSLIETAIASIKEKFESFKTTMEGVFKKLKDNIVGIMGVVVGVTVFSGIIKGIMLIVEAVLLVKKAWNAVTVAEIVAESMLTGGTAIVGLMAIAAASYAAAVLAMNKLESMFNPPDKPKPKGSSKTGEEPKSFKEIFEQMQKDADAMTKLMETNTSGATTETTDTNKSGKKDDAPAPLLKKSLRFLEQISSNTKASQQSLQKIVFGGNGNFGITAVELSAQRRSGHGKHIDRIAQSLAAIVMESSSYSTANALRSSR